MSTARIFEAGYEAGYDHAIDSADELSAFHERALAGVRGARITRYEGSEPVACACGYCEGTIEPRTVCVAVPTGTLAGGWHMYCYRALRYFDGAL